MGCSVGACGEEKETTRLLSRTDNLNKIAIYNTPPEKRNDPSQVGQHCTCRKPEKS